MPQNETWTKIFETGKSNLPLKFFVFIQLSRKSETYIWHTDERKEE